MAAEILLLFNNKNNDLNCNKSNFFLIVTWSIGSINTHLTFISNWLKIFNPDIILFQEIKLSYEKFPFSFLCVSEKSCVPAARMHANISRYH